MRPLAGLAVALLVVLAGCSAGYQGSVGPDEDGLGDDAPETTATPDDGGTDDTGSDDTGSDDGGTDDTGSDNTGSDDDGADDTGGTAALADPATDVLGWEDGYWYNESLAVDASDGMNETERRAFVARTMARVERIRELEFQKRVPVEVVSRQEYREKYAGGNATYGPDFRTFDNAKFEAMFLIGEDRDSLDVQNQNRGSNVLGFYSSRNDTIVVVSDSAQPELDDELTLSHELAHALQDQQFNLSQYRPPTRERYAAQNGLLEGDAHFVEQRYRERCESGEWDCVLPASGPGGGNASDIHLGVYVLNFFPYSDGPNFVGYHYRRGGWERVNAMYDPERIPQSTEQVVFPGTYGDDEPTNVTIDDTNTDGWARVDPEPPRPGQLRPDYAGLGMSGLTAMFAYTLYDPLNSSRVIGPRDFLNYEGAGLNRTDPFNYGFAYVDGWDGDRMHVYDNPDAGANESAYVWKLAWDSPAEAEEFATGYGHVLSHYGGSKRGCESGGGATVCTYEVTRGPFQDAFAVRVEGETVTVVNAPAVEDLADVSDAATVASGA